jgi:glycosyltransferase involved in cell wall biosynthesis
MKLIIQIPCLNEAETLAIALSHLPREIPGFDEVEWLVVDDGSSDDTAEIARRCGVNHVIRHPVNRGLAAAFMTGVDTALRMGADVIVNTDADNQYEAADIPKLVQPILQNRADMVIGARPIAATEHFSWIKKKLQHFGSWAVRIASKTEVADAPSGFRALSREAAMRLNVFNAYTYTLETIIQAGLSNLSVVSVPIRTNADLRPSRLVKSISSYVRRSLVTILRVFVIYRPLSLFFWSGAILWLIGLAAGARFLVHYALGDGSGHIQSLILTAVCLIIGGLLFMMGLIADLIATNRKLLERVHLRLQHIQHGERSTGTESLGAQAHPLRVPHPARGRIQPPPVAPNGAPDKNPT